MLANYGGVPLAFAWIATLGNFGIVTTTLGLGEHGWSLYNFWGLTLPSTYSIPLQVLTVVPALDGLRPQWREAAQNNSASTWQFWRYVGVPVLTPALLGGVLLLFGGAFAAYATAQAMVGSTVPLVTLKIADALSGNVLIGHENVALALGLKAHDRDRRPGHGRLSPAAAKERPMASLTPQVTTQVCPGTAPGAAAGHGGPAWHGVVLVRGRCSSSSR